jgi:hypothetical protein
MRVKLTLMGEPTGWLVLEGERLLLQPAAPVRWFLDKGGNLVHWRHYALQMLLREALMGHPRHEHELREMVLREPKLTVEDDALPLPESLPPPVDFYADEGWDAEGWDPWPDLRNDAADPATPRVPPDAP